MIQTINNEEHKIPEYFKVKIGKAEMELESDCLISTMCHQVIHKKNSLYNSEDFVMIKNNKNRESSNSQKTALTCRKGKNVKVISGKNPKCPKGYKTNLN